MIVLLIDLGLPTDADTAFRNRVIALTALVGFMPALFLTLLPGIVASIGTIVSSTLTFAFMGVIPLGYTYGILRYRVIQLDGMVSRAIGYLIVILGITLALSLGAATLRAMGVALAGPVFVPAMAGPGRMILTAARPDRTSFGCGVDNRYPFFDDCFLQSLPQATDFVDLAPRVQSCVSNMEATQGMSPPSEPQLWIDPGIRPMLPLYRFSAAPPSPAGRAGGGGRHGR